MTQAAAKSMPSASTMEAPVAPRRNLNRGKLGMACLICSEITFFGTLLATYLFYIGRDISGPYPQDVLDISVAPMKVVFNSIFLLTSSIWIVLAVKALRKGSHQDLCLLVAPDDPLWRGIPGRNRDGVVRTDC